jgi:hypothetical protein
MRAEPLSGGGGRKSDAEGVAVAMKALTERYEKQV